ncbi:MAG TPA: dihydrolipoyl dehydrogenase, partial [Coriobacteriia bacterium]
LNWGCVPTKTILRSARIAWDARRAAEFGLRLDPAEVDIERLMERKEGVVTELRGQIEATARRLKIDVVYGEGRMTGPKTVRVTSGGEDVDHEPDAVILATGSVPFRLPGIDHSLERVWTSDEAVSLVDIPNRVLIIGGGVIGLEFACAYASFGSEVHVVELTPTVLPGNDKRVCKTMQAALEGMGVRFYLGTKADTVAQYGETMVTTLADGTMIETDIVLSAVGRKPNSEGIGLENAGVEMDRAAVKVDGHLRTNVKGVYAIGDLIGGMMLAHVADEEGVVAARNALREYEFAEAEGLLAKIRHLPLLETVDYDCVPACVYTFPEVGVVGITRDGAKEKGLDAGQAVSKYSANGKALGEGEAEGFVQLVFENGSGRILGCQIVGPHAVETVHEVALAMRHHLSVRDIAETVHAHPTVSEVIKLAAIDAAEKADA